MPSKADEDRVPSERVQIVAPVSWVEAVDEWRRRQPGRLLNKSEAIRELVRRQLAAEDRSD
jgi:Arc/MetJ-type ribon-helix-helix transcriptional regulator